MPATRITDELKQLAKRNGVNIRDAIKASGVHRSTFHRWEGGSSAHVVKFQAVKDAIKALSRK
jgi:ACT domain-containing protein